MKTHAFYLRAGLIFKCEQFPNAEKKICTIAAASWWKDLSEAGLRCCFPLQIQQKRFQKKSVENYYF